MLVIVASLAEAWIEISVFARATILMRSPPSRRRGLKSVDRSRNNQA